MKQGTKIIVILFFLFAATGTATVAKEKARHVIFIGLDGRGSCSFEKPEQPQVWTGRSMIQNF